MKEPAGQEQRAFWAILLAMAVLLVWSVVFPPARAPERPTIVEEAPPPREPAQLESRDPYAATETSEEPSRPQGSLLGLETAQGALLRATGSAERKTIEIAHGDLGLAIDALGARATTVVLPHYEEEDERPVQLLPPSGAGALGSVIRVGDREISLDAFVFELVSDERTPDGRRLVWQLPLEELTLRKTFVVPDTGYVVQVAHELVEDRLGLTAWGLSWAGGMRHTEHAVGAVRGDYFQGSVLAEGKIQRKGADQLRKQAQEFPGTTYFVAAHNKYFVGAIVPRGDQQGPAKLWHVPSGTEGEASVGAEILAPRNSSLAASRVDYDVYIGPLDYSRMAQAGLGIEGVVDLGAKWIQPLSRMILGLLIWLHGLIPNYGVVIIIFASLINVLFFPLTFKSTRSMRDMAALKPRLDALKEKYKTEPQKMQEATMKLYKEAGVNPLAGCLPLLLQMPIFFALYAVLFRTIELRQEPFMLWIHDLSQPDVVFQLPFALPLIGSGICLLPIIMGVTSFYQSKATMVDPSQKAMLYMMPVMMTFIFFTMPSGLVLYWLTSNLFTIGQKFLMKPTAGAEDVAHAPIPAPPKGKSKGRRGAGRAEATSEG